MNTAGEFLVMSDMLLALEECKL